jgi:hypothetical protein
VCSTSATERVRPLAASAVQVVIDDRALDPRAIEMLSAILVRQNGARPEAAPSSAPPRGRRRLSGGRTKRRDTTRTAVR